MYYKTMAKNQLTPNISLNLYMIQTWIVKPEHGKQALAVSVGIFIVTFISAPPRLSI